MTQYMKLEFQSRLLPTDRDGDEPKTAVYLIGNWHANILVAPEMLRDASNTFMRVSSEGLLEMQVRNGWAVYKLSRGQPNPRVALAFDRVRYEQTEKL